MLKLSRPIVITLVVVGAFLAVLAGTGISKWRTTVAKGGQGEADPFRIAGNLYFVGATDIAAFLLTGPEGHILIDGGYPGNPPLIIGSIRKLGFDITDVKLILNSHAEQDHSGGIKELQDSSGAQVWVGEADAEMLGVGESEAIQFPIAMRMRDAGLLNYPAPRVDNRIQDGDTIRVGQTVVIAHSTPGHTRGCMTWEIPLREGKRELRAVEVCNLSLPPGARLVEPERYPGIVADFEATFKKLRTMRADIFLTNHNRPWGRFRKYTESKERKDPVGAFIDSAGFRAYIDSAEADFRRTLAQQQKPK